MRVYFQEKQQGGKWCAATLSGVPSNFNLSRYTDDVERMLGLRSGTLKAVVTADDDNDPRTGTLSEWLDTEPQQPEPTVLDVLDDLLSGRQDGARAKLQRLRRRS